MLESSAKRADEVNLDSVGKSLIKSKKRIGLRTQPWGVPFWGKKGECAPLTTTTDDRLFKKFLI